MKLNKSILAVAAVSALGAASANAGMILGNTRVANVLTVGAVSYDEVSIIVTGWNSVGAADNDGTMFPSAGDATGLTSVPNGVTTVLGTFAGVGSASILVPGAGTTWIAKTKNSNGPNFSATQGSFINFDATTSGGNPGFTRGTTVVANSSFSNFASGQNAWFTASKSADIRPVDVSVGDFDDGIDNTVLAYILVSHGGDVTFNGGYNTLKFSGQTISYSTVSAVTSSLSLSTAITATVTTIVGTGDKYVPAALGASNDFKLGGVPNPAGHTFAAFDFTYTGTGTPDYTTVFASLPAGATLAQSLLPFFNGAGAVTGGTRSYDLVVDLGAGVPQGTLTAANLPAGYVLNGIAVVPEASSIAGLALLGLPALARRRRA